MNVCYAAQLGLDPDDDSEDEDTPVGIGNLAGKALIAGRRNDGMNQEGFVDRVLRPKAFRDYTGYVPVNTAYELKDPTRWQPDAQLQVSRCSSAT